MCNLFTLASFGRNAPRLCAVFLHWKYRVAVDVLRVFGWLVHFAFCIKLKCASECVISY